VDTPGGESWFIHFQDKGPYGRVVHLQPMQWVAGWPLIGNDGEPVLSYSKPNVGRTYPVTTPADSDEFNGAAPGRQWQWPANPQPNWMFPAASLGFVRLFCIPAPEGATNLWAVPNLMLQKFPAPEFTATARITFSAQTNEDKAGLLVMGQDYSYIALRKSAAGLTVSRVVCKRASGGAPEQETATAEVRGNTIHLRVKVVAEGLCTFSHSADGSEYAPLGEAFRASAGMWIGAKVGVFATRNGPAPEYGYADVDWFRVE
jgi:beta-xylosidase